jgi:predicted O-methyltransferase YrrM
METVDPYIDSLAARIRSYANTAAANEALHAEFTELTDRTEFLKRHRNWVEMNRWGYGDRAFHHMWRLLIEDLAARFSPIRALEIGVYKGQTISLWAWISVQRELAVEITAISPFKGNEKPAPRWLRGLRKRLDPAYRRAAREGNLHPIDDYLARTREIFAAFDLDFDNVNTIRGLSTDPSIIERVKEERFALVYIDGDHSEEVARADIATYGPLVEPGGYLVLDDAGFFLPGTTFWKGIESVSRAADDIPSLGFKNVLNVGHNRIYRKVKE